MTLTRKILCVTLALLLLSWMAFIFIRSSKNFEQSSYESGAVIEKVAPIVNDKFPSYSPQEKATYIESLQFFTRKFAHLSAYILLGILASLFMFSLPLRRKPFCVPLLFGVLYAVSDEIHQHFVPGRSMELRDVLIDSSGVLTGAVASFLALFIFRKIRKARAKHKKAS